MKELIKQLNELSQLEPDQFKARSYRRAAISLSSLSEAQFKDRTSFLDLPGIGKSINSKIAEYKEKGVITKLLSLRNEQVNYLSSDEYKVRKTYVSKKITLQEARGLFADIDTYISQQIFGGKYVNWLYTYAGSLRRNKPVIGDIDILVNQHAYNDVVNGLKSRYELLVSGDEKTSFKLNNADATQLDIVKVNEVDAPFKLLYLTGSKEFNIMQRGIAKKKGLVLNQLGLFYGKKRIEGLKTEQDIFEYLGMKYVEPENR